MPHSYTATPAQVKAHRGLGLLPGSARQLVLQVRDGILLVLLANMRDGLVLRIGAGVRVILLLVEDLFEHVGADVPGRLRCLRCALAYEVDKKRKLRRWEYIHDSYSALATNT